MKTIEDYRRSSKTIKDYRRLRLPNFLGHPVFKIFFSKASCAVITIWEALIIGAVGSFLANITDPLLVYLKVDDAVGATCVHGFGGAWGMIAVGLFAAKDELENYCQYNGLFHGGGGYLLGVQLLATVSFITWAMLSTFILLFMINLIVPIR